MDASRGFDGLALVAAVLAAATAGGYVAIMASQGEAPLGWALGLMVLGAASTAYAVSVRIPHRRAVLATAGIALLGIGALAILTIGLPLMVAGVLALVAAVRSRPGRPSARERAVRPSQE